MRKLTAEEKAIRERAYGKRINFHTRHHWILTWLEEQPGKNLADKVFGVVERAYKADYGRRARLAMGRYWADAATDADKMGALCEAIECYARAGLSADEESAHDMLRAMMYRQAA